MSLLGLADAVLLLHRDELEQVIEFLQPAILVLGTGLEGAQRSQQLLGLLGCHGRTAVPCWRGDLRHYRPAQ